MSIILEKDFKEAVAELVRIIQIAKQQWIDKGFNFWPAKEGDAPETFKELKAYGRLFPVAAYGGETSIYGEDVNIDFRFWHDVLHKQLDADFTTEGENEVAIWHLQFAKDNGASNLALAILEADTKGQIAYYTKYGEFVRNQEAFVQTVINKGLKTALLVRM